MTVAAESKQEEADPKVFLYAQFAITLGISSKQKLKCLKILETDKRFPDVFSLLGEQQDLNETVGETLEEFTCRTDGKKTSVSMNKARYEVLQNKKAIPDPYMLLLSQDAVKMDIPTANFQIREWKNA